MYDELGYNTATNYYMKSLSRKDNGSARKTCRVLSEDEQLCEGWENFAKAMTDTVCPCNPRATSLRTGAYAQRKYDESIKCSTNIWKPHRMIQQRDAPPIVRSVSHSQKDSANYLDGLKSHGGFHISPAKYGDALLLTCGTRCRKKKEPYLWMDRALIPRFVHSESDDTWMENPNQLKVMLTDDRKDLLCLQPGDSVMYFTRQYLKKK